MTAILASAAIPSEGAAEAEAFRRRLGKLIASGRHTTMTIGPRNGTTSQQEAFPEAI